MDVNGDLKAMLDALTARVTLLEDERAILDTLHRYGQAADRGDDADRAAGAPARGGRRADFHHRRGRL